MNKSWFYLGAIGSLAIVMTSCGDNKPPTPAPSPSAAVSSSPVAAVPATTPVATTVTTATTTTTTAATVTPTISGKKSVSVDVAAGLIAPTNGDNWAKTVSKGRSDPFAALALQPIEVAEKDPLNGTGKPQKVASEIATNPRIAVKTVNQTKTIASNSSAIKSGVNKKLPIIKVSSSVLPKGTNITKQLPSIVKIATQPTKLPKVAAGGKIASNRINRDLPKIQALPPAKPEHALAIQISGVIEAAGKTQVIIKLPGESFSRYIEVGERVANGKVLIKRVEGQLSFSPTVVLEEVGVEVPRKIGDRQVAIAPQSASQPAATVPSTPNPVVEIVPSAPQPATITPESTSKP
ncbi:hypothetical protein [Chamaesiphon sp.]|uniref:hypothetical protein n=1 Tax=Chamaesiphon sp. TaxID=2814140 RepID=UPI0035947956